MLRLVCEIYCESILSWLKITYRKALWLSAVRFEFWVRIYDLRVEINAQEILSICDGNGEKRRLASRQMKGASAVSLSLSLFIFPFSVDSDRFQLQTHTYSTYIKVVLHTYIRTHTQPADSCQLCCLTFALTICFSQVSLELWSDAVLVEVSI